MRVQGSRPYTGLRVGVSTAKGLCFGAKVPLISAGTLDTLVAQAACEGLLPEGCTSVVPMIDARRMEVYTATFDPQGLQKTETEPMIIDSASFSDILEEGPVLFIGDAADKCRPVLTHPNAHFAQCFPKASAMAGIASRQLEAGRIEDVAYFEPFYLKEFVATTSKKKLF